MKREVLTSKIEPKLKQEFTQLAQLKNTTSSELNERLIRAYIKQQKQKGVIQ